MNNKLENRVLSVLTETFAGTDSYKIFKMYNENKEGVTETLVTKLFRQLQKVRKPAGTKEVENTKGDITKLVNYKALDLSIKFLVKNGHLAKNNSINDAITEIVKTQNNLTHNSSIFKGAYQTGNTALTDLYNLTVISLVAGTSFVVAKTVNYLSDGSGQYDYLLDGSVKIDGSKALETIKEFNKTVTNGQLSKLASATIIKEDTLGDVAAKYANKLAKKIRDKVTDTDEDGKRTLKKGIKITGEVIGALALIFFVCKHGAYWYYYSKIKLSEYLDYLSEFTENNASKMNDKDSKEKQQKWAERFKKWSEKIAVDQKVASDKADSQSKKDSKKDTLDDNDIF